jgi:hypothetical protein
MMRERGLEIDHFNYLRVYPEICPEDQQAYPPASEDERHILSCR